MSLFPLLTLSIIIIGDLGQSMKSSGQKSSKKRRSDVTRQREREREREREKERKRERKREK